jgi:3-oxoacyl-[acyl-carrier protein] reductase
MYCREEIMIDLAGKTVLITGGSQGIGAACAVAFARAGARVAFTYSKAKKYAENIANQIENEGGESIFFRMNIASYSECKKTVQSVRSSFKRIDILVNNAGIWEEGALGSMTESAWTKTIDINLNGMFRMCNLIIPIMKKQKSGKIINIASTAGQRGEAFHSHYAASKGGMIAFTKSLAVELIADGIYVNCVAPGWVKTEMTSSVWKNRSLSKQIYKTLPRGKFGSPEEIAGPVLFLSSNLADNIVGEILNVNGGSVLCG